MTSTRLEESEQTRPLPAEEAASSPGQRSGAAPATRAVAGGESQLALPAGHRLQEFVIESTIGEGGFGVVYLARDTRLDRVVAIKEFLPGAFASRTREFAVSVRSEKHRDSFTAGRRSFINEAKLLAQFDHPALVKVYRYWEQNGTAYIVMPYYPGLTLKDWLHKRQDGVSERRLLGIVDALCDPLETLHASGVFHRDIAPDNIRILESGQPVLLDLGAARKIMADMTQNLTVFFKAGFAPIEQYAEVDSLRQGPWTDVYALSAVLYYCVAGRAPPAAAARMLKDECIAAAVVGAGRYSDGFLTAIDAGLAVRPERRTRTIADFRASLRLQRAEAHPPRADRRPAQPEPKASAKTGDPGAVRAPASGRGLRRSWTRICLAGAGALALVLFGGSRIHDRSASDRARTDPAAAAAQDHAAATPPSAAVQQAQQAISAARTRISNLKQVLAGARDLPPALFETSDAALDDALMKLASGQIQPAVEIARAATDDAERSARDFLLDRELTYRQLADHSLRSGDIPAAESALGEAKAMRSRSARL